ncbi:MAG TPA: helix-turn-helix domain-containing protein [Gemmatimonadaceae bacterium]|nr:helix-turn-helix domain-containing protein [Gemmatimonadaceae bacterium]
MSPDLPLHVVNDTSRAAAMLQPLRLRILAELAEPDSAAGLSRRLGLPRQQLNYHLRQLEEQGLLEPVGERKKRNCTERLLRAVARSYVISPAILGGLASDPSRMADRMSSAYMVAVAAQVIREVAALRERAEEATKKLPTLTLQSEVRFASSESQQAFAQELSREVARVIAKYHDADAPSGRTFRFFAGAYPAPSGSHATRPTEEEK